MRFWVLLIPSLGMNFVCFPQSSCLMTPSRASEGFFLFTAIPNIERYIAKHKRATDLMTTLRKVHACKRVM